MLSTFLASPIFLYCAFLFITTTRVIGLVFLNSKSIFMTKIRKNLLTSLPNVKLMQDFAMFSYSLTGAIFTHKYNYVPISITLVSNFISLSGFLVIYYMLRYTCTVPYITFIFLILALNGIFRFLIFFGLCLRNFIMDSQN